MIEYVLVLNCALTGVVAICFVTETCSIVISMANDIKHDFNTINTCHNIDRFQALTQFTNLIQFHSNMKQLSRNHRLSTFKWQIIVYNKWKCWIMSNNLLVLDLLVIFRRFMHHFLWLWSHGAFQQYAVHCWW